MKGKEGFGYFKGRKKNQKKCELAKKLRVGLIKLISKEPSVEVEQWGSTPSRQLYLGWHSGWVVSAGVSLQRLL